MRSVGSMLLDIAITRSFLSALFASLEDIVMGGVTKEDRPHTPRHANKVKYKS